MFRQLQACSPQPVALCMMHTSTLNTVVCIRLVCNDDPRCVMSKFGVPDRDGSERIQGSSGAS